MTAEGRRSDEGGEMDNKNFENHQQKNIATVATVLASGPAARRGTWRRWRPTRSWPRRAKNERKVKKRR